MFRFIVVVAVVDLAASIADAQSNTNILSLLPQATPSTDYTKTINEAAAAGRALFLPNTGKAYIVSGPIQFSTRGASLIGETGTTLEFTGKQTFFRVLAPDITFQDITFDGTALKKTPRPEAYCLAPRFKWKRGGLHFGGPVFLQKGCDGAQISGVKADFDSSTAFTVMAKDVTITNADFSHNLGFGIFATKGATGFLFSGNRGDANGIEAIAVGHGASGGEIRQNVITGSGDNCISISGDEVRVIGNTLKYCLCHGIGVYGSNNIISNNTFIDNGQINNPSARPIALWNGTSKEIYHSPGYAVLTYDAIMVAGAFGGNGQSNRIDNNTVSDDQVVPTQGGIVVKPAATGNHIGTNSMGRHRSS